MSKYSKHIYRATGKKIEFFKNSPESNSECFNGFLRGWKGLIEQKNIEIG